MQECYIKVERDHLYPFEPFLVRNRRNISRSAKLGRCHMTELEELSSVAFTEGVIVLNVTSCLRSEYKSRHTIRENTSHRSNPLEYKKVYFTKCI